MTRAATRKAMGVDTRPSPPATKAVAKIATPEAFARNPRMVWQWYAWRRELVRHAEPNAGHLALAALERRIPSFAVVTQNVDDLHERTGSRRLLHMHGELLKARCVSSGEVFEWRTDLLISTLCPCCGKAGSLRPDIVWFGEIPFFMEEIAEALCEASLFVSVGTSGQVYPAAGFVGLTRPACHRIELNPEETPLSPRFDEHRIGPASVEVPKLVKELLGTTPPGA
jgi:NAD-dependent deacetylase